MTQIAVFYNVTKDAQGRSLGMLDQGKRGTSLDGHIWEKVYEGERRFATDLLDACEVVYRDFNAVDGSWREMPGKLGIRSMSVGDIVEFADANGRRAFIVRGFGFEEVSPSAFTQLIRA